MKGNVITNSFLFLTNGQLSNGTADSVSYDCSLSELGLLASTVLAQDFVF